VVSLLRENKRCFHRSSFRVEGTSYEAHHTHKHKQKSVCLRQGVFLQIGLPLRITLSIPIPPAERLRLCASVKNPFVFSQKEAL
jgi:hypothetical protein